MFFNIVHGGFLQKSSSHENIVFSFCSVGIHTIEVFLLIYFTCTYNFKNYVFTHIRVPLVFSFSLNEIFLLLPRSNQY
jgi:hypothetical protein